MPLEVNSRYGVSTLILYSATNGSIFRNPLVKFLSID